LRKGGIVPDFQATELPAGYRDTTLGQRYASQEQNGKDMRQIPVEYAVQSRIKSSMKGVGRQRDTLLIALKISDYKVLKYSSHRRVTHNLAALTHNLAAKRVKR
jgi:hypothetical protein